MVAIRALWLQRYQHALCCHSSHVRLMTNDSTSITCCGHYGIVRRKRLRQNEINRIADRRKGPMSHYSKTVCVTKSTTDDSTSAFAARNDRPQQESQLLTKIKVIFFSQVSIEPTYSAAGVRSLHLLNQFLRRNDTEGTNHSVVGTRTSAATEVHIISPPSAAVTMQPVSCTNTQETNATKFQYHTLRPNRADDAYQLLDQVCSCGTSSDLTNMDDTFYIVIYDRYYSEEMYSFQVYNYFHNNKNIKSSNHPPRQFQYMFLLDMQDMHSLRYTRQLWVQRQDMQRTVKQKYANACTNDSMNGDDTTDGDVLQNTIPSDDIVPSIIGNDKSTDKLLRELASIYRCDLTLVCSRFEYNLLVHYYHIPASKLCIAPLFGTSSKQPPRIPANVDADFQKRHDYVFVGGMKHEPNVDAIRQMKRLWPQLRQKFLDDTGEDNRNADSLPRRLPNLYIYGAQCSDHFCTEIHDPSKGLYMEGYYPLSISNVLWNKRVLVSPLRFGAGIKGKHIEAWNCSLPIVTTSIGSEGMMYPNTFNSPDFLASSTSTSGAITSTHPEQLIFGGCIANSDAEFINAAYTLYSNKDVWDNAVQSIRKEILYELCDDWDRIDRRIVDAVQSKISKQQRHQPQLPTSLTATDVVQELLRHQTNRSTEYFSRYIELKEEERNTNRTS